MHWHACRTKTLESYKSVCSCALLCAINRHCRAPHMYILLGSTPDSWGSTPDSGHSASLLGS
jgi:hypothetical protein